MLTFIEPYNLSRSRDSRPSKGAKGGAARQKQRSTLLPPNFHVEDLGQGWELLE